MCGWEGGCETAGDEDGKDKGEGLRSRSGSSSGHIARPQNWRKEIVLGREGGERVTVHSARTPEHTQYVPLSFSCTQPSSSYPLDSNSTFHLLGLHKIRNLLHQMMDTLCPLSSTSATGGCGASAKDFPPAAGRLRRCSDELIIGDA